MTAREPDPARNAALLLATNVYRVVCNALLFFIIARFLGSTELGRYQFALSFAALFGVVVHLGLNDLIVRQVAVHRDRAGEYLTQAFIIKLVLGVLVTAITVGSITLSGRPPDLWELVAVAAVTLSFVAALDTILVAFFYAFERVSYLLALGVVRGTLVVGLGSAAVAFGSGARGVLWGLLAAESVYLGLAFFLLRKRLGVRFERFNLSKALSFIKEGVPFALNGIFVIIYGQLHYTLLGFWAGDAATGEYAAAARPLGFLVFVPSAVTQALFPYLSRKYAASPDEVIGPLVKSVRYLWALSVPVAVFAFLRANEVIGLLFGPDYTTAAHVLRIIAPVVPVIFCGYPLWAGMNAVRKERENTAVTGAAVVVNVVINFVLTPAFGPTGAAVAYVSAEAVQSFVRVGLLYKYLGGLGLFKNLVAVLPAAGLLLFLLLLPYRLSVYWEVLIYGAVYVGVLFLTRGVSYRELAAIVARRGP